MYVILPRSSGHEVYFCIGVTIWNRIVMAGATGYMYNGRRLPAGIKWRPQKSVMNCAHTIVCRKRRSLVRILNHSGPSQSSPGPVLSGTWVEFFPSLCVHEGSSQWEKVRLLAGLFLDCVGPGVSKLFQRETHLASEIVEVGIWYNPHKSGFVMEKSVIILKNLILCAIFYSTERMKIHLFVFHQTMSVALYSQHPLAS